MPIVVSARRGLRWISTSKPAGNARRQLRKRRDGLTGRETATRREAEPLIEERRIDFILSAAPLGIPQESMYIVVAKMRLSDEQQRRQLAAQRAQRRSKDVNSKKSIYQNVDQL